MGQSCTRWVIVCKMGNRVREGLRFSPCCQRFFHKRISDLFNVFRTKCVKDRNCAVMVEVGIAAEPEYWDTPYSSNVDCQGTWFWFRFDYYTSSYTDYYKMFQYRKVEDLESTTQVSAGTSGNVTISNVNRWVRWRPKTMELSVTEAGSTTLNGHTYKLYTSNSPIAWEMAKYWCENNNGYLVCVTSAEENTAIRNLANGRHAWLGGYRVNGSDWAWISGEAFSYSDWRNGEPNNSCFAEWYLHYHANNGWNDIPAVNSSVYAFIIETDSN